MPIETRPIEPDAGGNALDFDISATSSRLVFDVSGDQLVSVQAVPHPANTSGMGSTVITLRRSNDGLTDVALATATTLATGNGWFADVDKSASPFRKLIVQVTTGHGSASQKARLHVYGAPKYIS